MEDCIINIPLEFKQLISPCKYLKHGFWNCYEYGMILKVSWVVLPCFANFFFSFYFSCIEIEVPLLALASNLCYFGCN